MRRRESKHWDDAGRAVAQVLLRDWDPIGVSDVPTAQDEYDAYVSIFVALLTRGAPEEEIVHTLHWIETEYMGLHGSSVEALAGVAQKLRAIYP